MASVVVFEHAIASQVQCVRLDRVAQVDSVAFLTLSLSLPSLLNEPQCSEANPCADESAVCDPSGICVI